MANPQPSFAIPPSVAGSSTASPSPLDEAGAGGGAAVVQEAKSMERLVVELCYPELRENSLQELSKRKEIFHDLGPLLLWHNALSPLFQEIVSIYPALSPPTLTPAAAKRACNALTLLQCVALHRYTKELFLNAHTLLYLYPLLNVNSNTIHFENLWFSSLGVIEALIKVNDKVNDTKVISFLLQTEIIPLCLRTMETGSELSKTVATFIIEKILLDDVGQRYICATAERFFAVRNVLANMLASLANQPIKLYGIPSRRLKPIIQCYLRLSDDPRACAALQNCLPDMLRDGTFGIYLREDPASIRSLQQLLDNVTPGGGAPSVKKQIP